MAVWTRWLTMLADLTNWGTALRFLRYWSPKVTGAFFEARWLEPEGRKVLLGEFLRRQLLTEIFEAIRPGLAEMVEENIDSPPDDAYVALHHDSLLEVDLYDAEYDARFSNAAIYRWRPVVWAKQITAEQIRMAEGNSVSSGGIHFRQIQGNCYRYAFNEPYADLDDEGNLEIVCRKVVGLIDEGEWLVKDPELALMHGRDTRFFFREFSSRDFWERYAATMEPGRFRPRTMYRAFHNPTRRDIETVGPRGVGYGDPWSWLVMPYDFTGSAYSSELPRYPVSFWWFEQFFERCPGRGRPLLTVRTEEPVRGSSLTGAFQPT